MRKISLFEVDERGVSPVIGVILMVAITVILAAVIGAFVLDLGSQLGTTGPQSQLAIADAGNTQASGTIGVVASVEHKGGDDLKHTELKLIVTDPAGTTHTIDGLKTGGAATDGVDVTGLSGEAFTVGETFTISESGTNWVDPGQEVTVKIIHKPSNSVVSSSKVEVR